MYSQFSFPLREEEEEEDQNVQRRKLGDRLAFLYSPNDLKEITSLTIHQSEKRGDWEDFERQATPRRFYVSDVTALTSEWSTGFLEKIWGLAYPPSGSCRKRRDFRLMGGCDCATGEAGV